jgi:hypothetical protein
VLAEIAPDGWTQSPLLAPLVSACSKSARY